MKYQLFHHYILMQNDQKLILILKSYDTIIQFQHQIAKFLSETLSTFSTQALPKNDVSLFNLTSFTIYGQSIPFLFILRDVTCTKNFMRVPIIIILIFRYSTSLTNSIVIIHLHTKLIDKLTRKHELLFGQNIISIISY